MSNWLIIHTPRGVQCWDVGEPSSDELETLINAARVSVGFPAADDWMSGSTWDIQLTSGEPHPTLLAKARVGTLAELAAVDASAIAEHVAARTAWYDAQAAAGLRAQLLGLAPQRLAELLADPEIASRLREG